MKRYLYLLVGGILLVLLLVAIIVVYVSTRITLHNQSRNYKVKISNPVVFSLAVAGSGILTEGRKTPLNWMETGEVTKINVFIVDNVGEDVWEMGEDPDTGELTPLTTSSYVYDKENKHMNLSIYVSPVILGRTVNAQKYYREKMESAFLQGLFKSLYVTDLDRETFHLQMGSYLNLFATPNINFFEVET